jgi:4-hydroxybenzoate polyprenyltransferase
MLYDAPEIFPDTQLPYFIMLMAASVLIAAGGYIINDYFDVQIDAVNKPERVLVNRVVKRRWAILWHLVFSITGIVLSAYIGYKMRSYTIAFGNVLCVVLLWFYSTTFKRQLLTGNIIISALTAWVIIVLYFFAGARIIGDGNWGDAAYPFDIRRLFKFTFIYAGFAFIISLIREVVKDLEDLEGDARYNCRTMPVVWGVPASKVFVGVWLIVLVVALTVILFYALKNGWYAGAIYGFIAVELPLLFILFGLKKAVQASDYHRLSNQIKWVMFAGILSMIFFYLSPLL